MRLIPALCLATALLPTVLTADNATPQPTALAQQAASRPARPPTMQPVIDPAKRVELDKASALLKTSKKLTYDWFERGEKVGTVVMTNELVEVDGRQMLRMTTELRPGDPRDGHLKCVALCDPQEPLSLTQLEIAGEGEFRTWRTSKLTVADGRVTGVSRSKPYRRDVPAGAVLSLFEVLRAVTLMPDKPDTWFIFNYLDTYYTDTDWQRAIHCAEAGETTVGGKPIRAWKFEFVWPDDKTDEFWVDEDHVLRRAWIDEQMEWVLIGQD
ncbi:MAG: hypothetical protein PVJ57_14735 [Phycisphaerae bacterium]|jgi:hypothetical protein